MTDLQALAREIRNLPRIRRRGRLTSVAPARLDAVGLGRLPLGARVALDGLGRTILSEVVASAEDGCTLLPFDVPDGLAPGAGAVLVPHSGLRPSSGWLGRIVDPLGRPLDGRGPLPPGDRAWQTRASPPPATERGPIGAKLRTGVHALDLFAPLCRGQRVGLFAGSGVGKSTLLGMLTARTEADAVVVALIGERGREVRAFVEDTLGPALARAVVVVATSDQSAVLRREAAFAATTVAEALAGDGRHVLLVMDSVTRFAMASREIGVAAKEPPATRGYPPSVFADLPRLLERTGPGGRGAGPITAVYAVLVEGGDHDEPIADAVRGILDGHVVLSRGIAERGRFPAIDVLKSVSRTLPGAHEPDQVEAMGRARRLLAVMADMEELVRLGAYEVGSNAEVDRALRTCPGVEALLTQNPDAPTGDDPWSRLAELLEAA